MRQFQRQGVMPDNKSPKWKTRCMKNLRTQKTQGQTLNGHYFQGAILEGESPLSNAVLN